MSPFAVVIGTSTESYRVRSHRRSKPVQTDVKDVTKTLNLVERQVSCILVPELESVSWLLYTEIKMCNTLLGITKTNFHCLPAKLFSTLTRPSQYKFVRKYIFTTMKNFVLLFFLHNFACHIYKLFSNSSCMLCGVYSVSYSIFDTCIRGFPWST